MAGAFVVVVALHFTIYVFSAPFILPFLPPAELFAKYNCTNCQDDIQGVRVQCVDCEDFQLCLQVGIN